EQPEQRAAATEKLGVPALATVDEALALKPALVLIGALPAKRADLAARAIAAGAAALVDKPLAVTHEALEALKAAVAKHGKPAIAYYPYRGHPLVLAAKKLIDDGAIGKLVRV